jgi:hypothetical protein
MAEVVVDVEVLEVEVVIDVEVVVGELVSDMVCPEPVVVPVASPVYPVKLATGVTTAVYDGGDSQTQYWKSLSKVQFALLVSFIDGFQAARSVRLKPHTEAAIAQSDTPLILNWRVEPST